MATPSLATLLSMLPGFCDDLVLEHVSVEAGAVHVRACTATLHACCPSCSTRSRRLHETYVRTLADLAWQRTPVRVHLRVRRFRCESAVLTPNLHRATSLLRSLARAADRPSGRPAHARGHGAGRRGERTTGAVPRRDDQRRHDAAPDPARPDAEGCPPRACSAWMSGLTARGIATARSSWTWSDTRPSTSCPTVPRRASPRGLGSIPGSRSSRAGSFGDLRRGRAPGSPGGRAGGRSVAPVQEHGRGRGTCPPSAPPGLGAGGRRARDVRRGVADPTGASAEDPDFTRGFASLGVARTTPAAGLVRPDPCTPPRGPLDPHDQSSCWGEPTHGAKVPACRGLPDPCGATDEDRNIHRVRHAFATALGGGMSRCGSALAGDQGARLPRFPPLGSTSRRTVA